MPNIVQLEFQLSSLDFPGRRVLYPLEVSQRLGVTVDHIYDLIDEGLLVGIDLAGKGASRRLIRIPIESYRNFVVQRVTGPARRDFLRALPPATLRELHAELSELLAVA